MSLAFLPCPIPYPAQPPFMVSRPEVPEGPSRTTPPSARSPNVHGESANNKRRATWRHQMTHHQSFGVLDGLALPVIGFV